MKKLTCTEARRINLVSYLNTLGYQPVKVRNNEYWYLSPLRNEHTASFKVDDKRNIWYDHGMGKGGDLINFGTLFFNCSVSELLQKLSGNISDNFSFHPQHIQSRQSNSTDAKQKLSDTTGKILIAEVRPMIADSSLIQYLADRHVSLAIAQKHCKEVDFFLYGRQYTVIGFPNNAGGFELRSAGFKGSSSPKEISLFQNSGDGLNVFEGFFDYLSYMQMDKTKTLPAADFLVLNSLSYFEKSRPLMDSYSRVNLHLDNDDAGRKWVQEAATWDSERYKDRSHLYHPCHDLNDWLQARSGQRKTLRSGKHL